MSGIDISPMNSRASAVQLRCMACKRRSRFYDRDARLSGQVVVDFLLEHRGCKRAAPKRTAGRPTLKVSREKKRSAHAKVTAALRERVMVRSCGRCEACRQYGSPEDPLELDHLIRGSGMRRFYQGERTTWAIHRSCHRARHDGRTDGATWPAMEAAFLARHSYPVHRLIMRRWMRQEESHV